jgi:hypothetical protein
LFLQLLASPVDSERIEVRRRGIVDLATFECRDINRSTVLQRVCYDRAQKDLIVATDGGYNEYCGVPADTVDRLMGAPSMGQFFNQNIKREASGARYLCHVMQLR